MRSFLLIVVTAFSLSCFAQDTTGIEALGKETVLSEVVIRSGFDVNRFLQQIKNDTTFYKAFRTLHILGFTSFNDIKMRDADGNIKASLFSKTRQNRSNGCRTMDVLEQRTTGDMYKHGDLNYYTAELYAGLFFTNGKVCGENNIVAGKQRDVRSKSGIEKHKEQLKMLFFNPGQKIPGIPFIGDKIDIFDPSISRKYDFSIDMDEMNGQQCYLFKIIPKENTDRDDIVFDNITTWFNAKTMEIVARNYDLSYDTPVYDFNVHMEVRMTKFQGLLVPSILTYNGNWKVAFKKRERGLFTATLFDFNKGN
ncbi:MAG TPA: hypothetical protein VNT20_15090 [Flavisolibacter sp.]|jgi:hypothetical protein|nr:hypothetical protein [Flavisolibacter sp.]